MIGQPRLASAGQPTLRAELRRAHLGLVLIAVALAGGLLSAVAVVALRAYAEHNLQLVARSIGYTVEAALVFNDRIAAREALSTIAEGEEISQLKLLDAHGRTFVKWTREKSDPWDQLGEAVLPATVTAPIQRDGEKLGELQVQGGGAALLRFLLRGLAAMLVCLAATAAFAIWLSSRILGSIVVPLQTMARVTHAVRFDRSLDQRVPPARVAELNAFGDDLNALLDELAQREAELRSENVTLAHRASHDSLTGVANRALFERRLEQAVAQARATQGHIAVLFFDLNRFKEINDTLGHPAGDAVLQVVAARLGAKVRETDLVARFGGDEFGMLVSPLRDGRQAQRIAESVVESMAAPVSLRDGSELVASLSVGVAVYPDDAGDAAALLQHADTAMYEYKRRLHEAGARGIVA